MRRTRTGPGRTDAALELFPDSAEVVDGELRVGGIGVAALADEFGTPLVVYCEQTIRTRAQAYRVAAPDALVVYGTKAFPNVAILRLLAEEGLGADVSTLGELRFAQRAGVPGERLVVHGNNKSDEELAAAVEARAAYVVLDSVEELDRARAAGVERMLVRITPGIEADTHESIRTGQFGSKFGVSPEEAAALAPHVDGLHVHVGSQLARARGRAGDRGVAERLPRGEPLGATCRRSRRRARRADAARRTGAVDRGVRRRARAAGSRRRRR